MLRSLIHWFFPNKCIFCNGVIESQGYCCDKCRVQLPVIPESVCLHCGGIPCRCGSQVPYYDRAVSPFVYDLGAKNAVGMIKFYQRPSYAKGLADAMLQRLRGTQSLEGITCVTAVPMVKKDEYDRGYNQSALLAKEIAEKAGLPYAALLKKLRSTKKQHDLTAAERRENLKGAFAPTEKAKQLFQREQTVLLCDDVLTTGATLNECAGTLKSAGAGKIICCTAAVATCRNGQDMVK